MILEYSDKAKNHLKNLPRSIIERILDKMDWFLEQQDPLSFSEPLQGTKEKLYRFRIGNYRVICSFQNGTFHVLTVLAVKHRREAYRK